MNLNPYEVAHTLVELEIPAEKQGSYLLFAVARVVAYLLPLPSEAVANAADYFETQLATRAGEAIGAFNERFPLDYNATIELIRQLWLVRYNLVYPTSFSMNASVLDRVLETAGVVPEGISVTDGRIQALCRAITAGEV